MSYLTLVCLEQYDKSKRWIWHTEYASGLRNGDRPRHDVHTHMYNVNETGGVLLLLRVNL